MLYLEWNRPPNQVQQYECAVYTHIQEEEDETIRCNVITEVLIDSVEF